MHIYDVHYEIVHHAQVVIHPTSLLSSLSTYIVPVSRSLPTSHHTLYFLPASRKSIPQHPFSRASTRESPENMGRESFANTAGYITNSKLGWNYFRKYHIILLYQNHLH